MKYNHDNKNYNTDILKIILMLFVSLYIFAILYYYFAFYIAKSHFITRSILSINQFVIEIFPGIAYDNMIGERLYGNGRYITYIAGVSILITIISMILSLFILIFKKLWHDSYSLSLTITKIIFSYIIFLLIILIIWYDEYYQIKTNIKHFIYFYGIVKTIMHISLGFALVSLNIEIIDKIRFWFVNKKL